MDEKCYGMYSQGKNEERVGSSRDEIKEGWNQGMKDRDKLKTLVETFVRYTTEVKYKLNNILLPSNPSHPFLNLFQKTNSRTP